MAYTRFGFSLAITFLALVAALLASVKAAPLSGLQSRDDASPPFSVVFTSPSGGQLLPRGGAFVSTFTITQTGDLSPPWSVRLFLMNAVDNSTTDIGVAVFNPSTALQAFSASVPGDASPGGYFVGTAFQQDSNSITFVNFSDEFQVV
ncbi:hypothetical protein BC826DRAFT_1179992 [Russula brevipes]|nr:hypothetical protein BC826DRAFT_1110814 [Russula brevipes]KAI0282413.1 hypothetical protein BC826DRAFT_1179992 [Russula brevipes]